MFDMEEESSVVQHNINVQYLPLRARLSCLIATSAYPRVTLHWLCGPERTIYPSRSGVLEAIIGRAYTV